MQSLSAQLNISYSTLARCKTGICPPSITYQALAGAFGMYKERYFSGNERLLADAILENLTRQGVQTDTYEQAYKDGGWEGLVGKFLHTALKNSKNTGSKALKEANSHDTDKASAAEMPSEQATTHTNHVVADPSLALKMTGTDKAVDSNQPGSIAYGLAGWVPIAAVVGIGLFQISLNSLLGWIAAHFGLFCVLSFAIAILPMALGFAVDAPVAWVRYKKRNPAAPFTWDAWRAVSRYGDITSVKPGEGRFNTSRNHVFYGIGCNVLGALCAISLFAFLGPLPGFLDYFAQHNWTEYFKAALVLAFFIAYHHTASQQNLPRLDAQIDAYNPDNYLYTRAHVWANIVHLVWVITLSAIFALCMLGYSIAHFQQFALPLTMLWPVAQTAVFLVYANVSPYAVRMKVASAGSFATSLVAMAVCMMGLVTCYRISWVSIAAVLVYACLATAALAWRKRMDVNEETSTWLEHSAGSRVYGILVAVVVVGLAAVGFATQALL